MSRSRGKNSGDVKGTAGKCRTITMKTKAKIIERLDQGEMMLIVTHAYNMGHWHNSKEGQDHGTCKVCCAREADGNSYKQEEVMEGGDGETSLCEWRISICLRTRSA